MRIYGPTGTRSGVQDRNPTSLTFCALQTIQHAQNVTFVDYTVPVGRRAYFGVCDVSTIVTVALDGGGIYTQTMQVKIAGGAFQPVGYRESAPNPPVGDHREMTLGQLWLKAGDEVQVIVSSGGATVGTLHSSGSLQGFEFDA